MVRNGSRPKKYQRMPKGFPKKGKNNPRRKECQEVPSRQQIGLNAGEKLMEEEMEMQEYPRQPKNTQTYRKLP